MEAEFTLRSGADWPIGEFSTIHWTRLSCCSRLVERDRTQVFNQVREGAQGKELSRNSKEVREAGREVMESLSRLAMLLLDRSSRVRCGSELKDDPGQRIEVRPLCLTVSLVRLEGRWEVVRQARFPLVTVTSSTPSSSLRWSVLFKPEQEIWLEVQVQGKLRGREGHWLFL